MPLRSRPADDGDVIVSSTIQMRLNETKTQPKTEMCHDYTQSIHTTARPLVFNVLWKLSL